MQVVTNTKDQTGPFSGMEGGSNPPSRPIPRIRLLVEGWRFLPHSYSIVNQQQCLELLRRPNVTLFHRDTLIFPQLGEPITDILPREDEDAIGGIPPPGPTDELDAIFRIGYPHDFGPSPCKAFVFATCERGRLKDIDVLGQKTTGGRMARAFKDRIRDHDITVITPSIWSKRGLIRSGIEAERIAVVPHGIDPLVFMPMDQDQRERERGERGQKGTFTFLHVSAMTGNKNVGGVIAAFMSVVKKHPHARLLLKGLDRLFFSNSWVSQEMGRLSDDERELASKTIFYSGTALTLKNQVKLYQLADAYVAPYQSEAFNIPVLEAAACGLPVITTKGGPTDEFTTPDFCLPISAALGDHHHDGSLWFDTDQQSIEQQMERAITDDEWRRVANIAGPEYTRANYSWKAVVDRLLSVIGSQVQLEGNP